MERASCSSRGVWSRGATVLHSRVQVQSGMEQPDPTLNPERQLGDRPRHNRKAPNFSLFRDADFSSSSSSISPPRLLSPRFISLSFSLDFSVFL